MAMGVNDWIGPRLDPKMVRQRSGLVVAMMGWCGSRVWCQSCEWCWDWCWDG
ncbi:MAG: hypothetical protein ACI8Y4_002690 [Candidatus Poriferisodalaceae bacterium]|jgi:hypothetical protein